VLHFDQSTAKHALQYSQNDCHQWPNDSSKVHQIRFMAGLMPWTPVGEIIVLPGVHNWFKGPYFSGEGKG